MELKLDKQRIRSQGTSYYLRIPKTLVDTGALSLEKEYEIRVLVEENKIIIEEATA